MMMMMEVIMEEFKYDVGFEFTSDLGYLWTVVDRRIGPTYTIRCERYLSEMTGSWGPMEFEESEEMLEYEMAMKAEALE